MTDRESNEAAAAHKVADALLPWFVNGTLEGEELAFVRSHVHGCAQCRSAVDWLRELHAACIVASDSPQASRAARRLQGHLDVPRYAARPAAKRATRWALAVAAAAVVGIGTAWIAGVGSPPLYHTLGASDASAPVHASIVVVFDPATTEFELRRIVRSAGGRIVDGPTQTNAYVLDVPLAQRPQALAMLRGERAVMLAERLDAAARR